MAHMMRSDFRCCGEYRLGRVGILRDASEK